MKILFTSLTYSLYEKGYTKSIKYFDYESVHAAREFYGDEVIQKFIDSGLYSEEDGEIFLDKYHLTANFLDGMPGILDTEDLEEYIIQYFKENEMWPMEKTPTEIARFSIDVSFPVFASAGLIELKQ